MARAARLGAGPGGWPGALAALGALVAVVTFGMAPLARAQAAQEGPPQVPLAMREIAPGVFVHQGRHEETQRDNLGDLANIGFVVGERCVAVIDTGGSRRIGEALREAVRRVTPLAVCYVVNTHMHPDHVFGNAAFVADRPVFVGHARLGAALAARGSVYLGALRRELGPLAEGTEVIAPGLAVADAQTLDLGARRLVLKAWPTAHTDNDLTVFDEASGTLWLGDLLFVERTPVIDGSLKGWLRVLSALPQDGVRHRVPGHGPADPPWPASLVRQQDYLRAVESRVRAALRANKTLPEMLAMSDTMANDGWVLHDLNHPRNLTAAFAELEWE